MTTKRRILWAVLVLACLSGLAVAVVLYLRESPGAVLKKAELALSARNYDRAGRLAERYIERYPDDWEGYYLLGRVLTARAELPEARRVLRQALERDLGSTKIAFAMAETYGRTARALIEEQGGTPADISRIERAIQEMGNARAFLAGFVTLSAPAELDVQEQLGRSLITIGRLHVYRSRHLAREAQQARTARLEHDARAKEAASQKASQQADAAFDEAIQVLLEVVRKDPMRGKTGVTLLELCRQREDDRSYGLAREAIRALDRPPPDPALWVALYELGKFRTAVDPAVRRTKLAETAGVLDRLLKQNPDHINLKVARADVALSLRDMATAERLCREVLEAEPKNPDARFVHAQMQTARGRLVEAERELFGVQNDYPRVARVQYAYALAALAIGKRGSALRAMKAVKQLDPAHAQARVYLAQLLLERGMAQEAHADARRGHELCPDDPLALTVYVEACVGAGQEMEARRALEQVRREGSDRADMLVAAADGYALLGDKERAAELAQRAVQITGPSVRARHARARALVLLGREAEAEKLFLDEIAQGGERPSFRHALGQLYQRTGRLQEAMEQYRRAVALDPTRTPYQLALARALLSVGDLAECKAVLDRVDPDNPEGRLLGFQVRLVLGQPVDQTQILQQTRGEGHSGLRLAMIYLAAGRLKECADLCKDELGRNPNEVNLLLLLGQAYLSAKQPSQCVKYWTQALAAAPKRLATYLALAVVMARAGAGLDEVVSHLAGVPGAQKDLIDFARSQLLAGQRNYSGAAAVLEGLLQRPTTPDYLRGRARMLRASLLALAGNRAGALAELEQISHQPMWHKVALWRQAELLVSGGQLAQADRVLTRLRAIAESDRDGSTLRGTVALYLRMHRASRGAERIGGRDRGAETGAEPWEPRITSPGSFDQWLQRAKAVCQQHERLFPKDSRSYLLWAQVWAAAGRPAEQIRALREAIDRQPGDPRTYLLLARIYDASQEPTEALAVLSRLEEVSDTAKAAAIWQRGVLFATWGLRTQAAEQFDTLVTGGHNESPLARFRLALACAHAGLRDKARDELALVPSYAREYLPAKLLLAELTVVNEEKLEILDKLAAEDPSRSSVLVARMKVLLAMGKPAEAAKAFGDFIKRRGRVPAEGGPLALEAQLKAGSRSAAANLCLNMHRMSGSPSWARPAVLLMLDDRPNAARRALPPIATAEPQDALLGVCLALRQLDLKTAGLWARQAAKPPRQKVAEITLKTAVRPHLLLTKLALSADKPSEAEIRIESLMTGVRQEAVAEMASQPAGVSRTVEAAKLLKASLALDLGLGSVGRKWAMEALTARPTCQWAAALIMRSRPDTEDLAAAHKLLEPKDCRLAWILRAEVLRRQEQLDEAAKVLGAAADMSRQDASLVARQADLLLAAGKKTRAMDLYRKSLLLEANPVVANNAASLAALVYADQPARLAAARKWAELAISSNRTVPAYHDTHGWIACLLGRHAEARKHLWQAVKGLPNDPTVHYHVGMVEAVAGSKQLARWHLEATLSQVNEARAERWRLSVLALDAEEGARRRLGELATSWTAPGGAARAPDNGRKPKP